MPQKFQIIDAHIHTAFSSKWFAHFIRRERTTENFSEDGLRSEMENSGVVAAISMGISDAADDRGFYNLDPSAPTPMGLGNFHNNKKVFLAGGINPNASGPAQLAATEQALSRRELRGLKIYLGYYPRRPDNKAYRPYLELAASYGVPVVFHTGDTWSKKGKLEFAQPLPIDSVAVDYPDVTFVIAHAGNPWFSDTAAVLYKNENVYADLSGLLSGRFSVRRAIRQYKEPVARMLDYVGNSEKFLFGSDWPVVGLQPYIRFLKGITPAEARQQIFYRNARKVFNLE